MSYTLTTKVGRRTEMTNSMDRISELKLSLSHGLGIKLVPDYNKQSIQIYSINYLRQTETLILEVTSET